LENGKDADTVRGGAMNIFDDATIAALTIIMENFDALADGAICPEDFFCRLLEGYAEAVIKIHNRRMRLPNDN
jgi:hypothetical protein